MTGRERLTAIAHKRPADRLAWTTLVDGNTLDALPDGWRGVSGPEFYRRLGCDTLLLDGWGTGHGLKTPQRHWPDGVTETWQRDGQVGIRELHGPGFTLTAQSRGGHPIKPLISTLAELRHYRTCWEGVRYTAADDTAAWQAINAAIGNDGIAMRFWGPSTIPWLIEFEFGTENFYYLLNDHPRDMAELISTIHARQLAAFDLLARGPGEVIALVENTSTYYISPDLYRRFNGPHVRDFVSAVHAAGKVAIIHMCGHVRLLLDQIRGTGLDGVHALTPPPTGDCPWELALDVLGEDCVLMTALDPTIFALGPVDQIGPALDRLYTPRLRRANVVLCAFADGIRVPLERFQALAAWFARQQ